LDEWRWIKFTTLRKVASNVLAALKQGRVGDAARRMMRGMSLLGRTEARARGAHLPT
jgi:hypothetical protein